MPFAGRAAGVAIMEASDRCPSWRFRRISKKTKCQLRGQSQKRILFFYVRSWNVYENKGKNDKKPDEIPDICAQLKRILQDVSDICAKSEPIFQNVSGFEGPMAVNYPFKADLLFDKAAERARRWSCKQPRAMVVPVKSIGTGPGPARSRAGRPCHASVPKALWSATAKLSLLDLDLVAIWQDLSFRRMGQSGSCAAALQSASRLYG